MKFNRIIALLYRDWQIITRVRARLAEILYYPIISVLIWGLFSIFMRGISLEAGLIVLIINIFWSFAYVSQSTTNLSMLEDVWSGSIKHLFVSGIDRFDFIIARLLFSTIISLFVAVIMFAIALYAFNITTIIESFSSWVTLTLITLVSSLALSILIAAFIIASSREYGFLAWTVLQIFIFLSAPFYPINILPQYLQSIAHIMPYTDVFQSARDLATTGSINSSLMVNGFILSVSYLAISFVVYYFAFNFAKRNGNLVRL